jgi:Mn-dependent DtxR family transcriptional regulator
MNLTNFEDMPDTKAGEYAAAVLEIIKDYGVTRPIKSYRIEKCLIVSGATVRGAVSLLRELGFPICSGSRGYYYDHTGQEITKTIAHLRQRATRMLNVANKLEQVKENIC